MYRDDLKKSNLFEDDNNGGGDNESEHQEDIVCEELRQVFEGECK